MAGIANVSHCPTMNIWIVNPFDNLPPEGLRQQRYWLMARAFVRAGHKVTYWSADFSHAYKKKRDVAALEGDYEGITLRLVHEPPYKKNICFKRLWSHWRFARNWLSECSGKTTPDVLIVSSPPLSLGAAARAFCRRTGARLVIDVQDAWPETFERVMPRFLLAPLRRLAGRNYRSADAITAVATRYLDLVRRYGAACPMHLCHIGIDCRIENEECRMENVPSHLHNSPFSILNSTFFRLVYIGNMSKSYDLATVIDSVRGMDGVTLELAGSGPDEPALRRRAADCPRIVFHGYLPEGELRALLSRSDAGIIPMFDDSCVGVPGKLSDYAAAGLPAVNSLSGETAALLERYSAGVKYSAGDIASFTAAVDEIRKLEKKSDADLFVEFDAGKLYNEYMIFLEKFLSNTGESGRCGRETAASGPLADK